MRRYILGLLLCAAATTANYAQTEVSAYQNGNADGITYYLPNTVLDITLEAVEITHTPGEFSAYANNYLHIGRMAQNPGRSNTIHGCIIFLSKS